MGKGNGSVKAGQGPKTIDVVLKHYFRPGREDFRRTLEAAMPRLFTEAPTLKALPSATAQGRTQRQVSVMASLQGLGSHWKRR
jgi:hypothetical protein